jgi:hypothetical protein
MIRCIVDTAGRQTFEFDTVQEALEFAHPPVADRASADLNREFIIARIDGALAVLRGLLRNAVSEESSETEVSKLEPEQPCRSGPAEIGSILARGSRAWE